MEKCKCLDMVEESLRKYTGDPEAKMTTSYDFRIGLNRPTVEYTYRKKKKNGTFMPRETKAILVPTYCPFCGVKYIEEGDKNDA